MPENQKPPLQDLGSLLFPEQNKPKLPFSQRLVGLSFNPSGDDKVNKAKQLCAELADLVNSIDIKEKDELRDILYAHTIGEILNAQMNVVKLLTLKY